MKKEGAPSSFTFAWVKLFKPPTTSYPDEISSHNNRLKHILSTHPTHWKSLMHC